MKRKYIREIFRILSRTNNIWVIDQIHQFAVNMTKKGGAADE